MPKFSIPIRIVNLLKTCDGLTSQEIGAKLNVRNKTLHPALSRLKKEKIIDWVLGKWKIHE